MVLDLDTAGCTLGWTLYTATGDVAIDVPYPRGPTGAIRLALPDGVAWTLSLPSLGQGIDARQAGPFITRGRPMRISGPWSCSRRPRGELTVTELSVIATPPRPTIAPCIAGIDGEPRIPRARGTVACMS